MIPDNVDDKNWNIIQVGALSRLVSNLTCRRIIGGKSFDPSRNCFTSSTLPWVCRGVLFENSQVVSTENSQDTIFYLVPRGSTNIFVSSSRPFPMPSKVFEEYINLVNLKSFHWFPKSSAASWKMKYENEWKNFRIATNNQ